MAQKFNSNDSKRALDGYRKRIARLNAYINEAVEKVGSNEVYLDRCSTIVSTPDSVWPFEEVATEDPERELVFTQKYIFTEYAGGFLKEKEEYYTIRIKWEYDEESDDWYANYYGDAFDFDDDVKYIRKCVRAAVRFWESEDPDRFLEQDNDDETEL